MIVLYARSRQITGAVAGLVVLGIVALLWGRYQLHLLNLRSNKAALVPVILVVPLASAAVIGASTRTWMHELEDTAAVRLWLWRLGHIVVLLAVAVLALTPAMLNGTPQFGSAAAFRNLLGYLGLTLITVPVAGAALSWVLPAAYAIQVALFAATASPAFHASWAWPLRPATSGISWVWAVGLACLGLIVFVRFGSRTLGADSPLGAT